MNTKQTLSAGTPAPAPAKNTGRDVEKLSNSRDTGTAGIDIIKTPAGIPVGIVDRTDTAGILDMLQDIQPVTAPAPVDRLDISRRCRLAVYVPSTIDTDQPVDQQEFTNRTDTISRFMSRLFGGVTVIPGAGYWLDPDTDRLIYERVNIVTSHLSILALSEHLDTVIGAIEQHRDLWRQTAVSVAINDTMILI